MSWVSALCDYSFSAVTEFLRQQTGFFVAAYFALCNFTRQKKRNWYSPCNTSAPLSVVHPHRVYRVPVYQIYHQYIMENVIINVYYKLIQVTEVESVIWITGDPPPFFFFLSQHVVIVTGLTPAWKRQPFNQWLNCSSQFTLLTLTVHFSIFGTYFSHHLTLHKIVFNLFKRKGLCYIAAFTFSTDNLYFCWHFVYHVISFNEVNL